MRAIDIVEAALRNMGEYAPGEPIENSDAQDALNCLNDILDEWSNLPQACFAQLTQSVTLVANQTQYTIGPSVSADINGTRPLKIVQATMTDTENNRYPIGIVTQYDWNRITNLQINGQVPTTLWYDPQMPIGILNFWPSPVLPWVVSVTSYLQLDAFPDLYTDVVLPRGYAPALKYSLEAEAASLFGKAPNPMTIEKASRYVASIKRTNYRDQPAKFDAELVYSPQGTGYYNIRDDNGAWGS